MNLNIGLTDSSLGSLEIDSSTVNGPGTLSNAKGLTLALSFDTINSALTNDGTITVIGDATNVAGAFNNDVGAIVDINNTAGAGDGALDVANLTNAGTINLQQPASSAPSVLTALLNLDSATSTATNTSTGKINVTAGNNAGTAEFFLNGGTFTNNGAIAITGTTTEVFLQNGTFTDAGSISLDAASPTKIQGGGIFNFNTGASLIGGGPLTFAGVTLNLNIGLTDSSLGSLEIDSSTVNGPGTLSNAKGLTLALSFDTINSALTNDGTITVVGNATNVAGAFNNDVGAIVDINNTAGAGDGALDVANLTNAGTINLQQPLSTAPSVLTAFLNLDTTGSTATNTSTGKINVTAGNNAGTAEFFLNGGTLTNNGAIAITGTTTDIFLQNGTFTNAGTFTANGATTIHGGGTFTNNGTATVGSGQTLDITGATFTNFNSTNKTLTGGTYHVIGTFQFDNALISNNAATIILDGASAKIVDQNGNSALTSFANNTSSGSFTIENGANYTAPGAFTNNGAVVIGATDTFTAILLYLQNSGTTTLNGGTLSVILPLVTTIAAPEIDIAGGELGGTGNLKAQVTINAGTFDPGGVGATGTLNVSGIYQQSGTLDVVLGGTSAGQFSVLNVGGAATLGGTLNVSEINGFLPVPGQNFQVLDFASKSGNFTTENGLKLANGAFLVPVFNPSANPTSLILETSGVVDETASFKILRGGYHYDFTNKSVAQIITLTNTSNTTITEPISLVLDNLTPGTTLTNASGTTSATSPAGSPYINLPSGSLAPGQSVMVVLQIADPTLIAINYTTRVLVGIGPR